jgi:hypothetical protein
MSSKKHKGAPRSGEGEVITEPRFAKAHTDRRFAKIGHKDKTVHLDSRFKHVVKERKFAISGMQFHVNKALKLLWLLERAD